MAVRTKISIGRIVGLVLAVAAFSMAVKSARTAVALNAEFHQWLRARPLELKVDLSKPGETTTSFRQTCHIAHSETLCLDLTPTPPDMEALAAQLGKELSGQMSIKDARGKEVETVKISEASISCWPGENKLVLGSVAPIRNGDYTATIQITQGAPMLAGKDQTLYAKYELCGMEEFPASIAAMFSFASTIIGLVAAVCVIPGLLREGITRPTQAVA